MLENLINLSSKAKEENLDYDMIYCCIPESTRELYGKTKEEQCVNFMKENPDIFGEQEIDKIDFSDEDKILDYIVLTLTTVLGFQNMAYKGGYILNKLMPNTRKTYDVDFSIAKKELYEDVKRVLSDIGDFLLLKNIITNFTVKEEISETSSGGIIFMRDAGKKQLGVDVGLHPLGYGITEMELSFCDIQRFTVERTLADKISVLCSPKRFRRVKDLFDTYMFITMFDINGSLLSNCITYRTVNYDLKPVDPTVIVQLKVAYDKLRLGFDNVEKVKPDFDMIYNVVIKFINGCETCKGKIWNHEGIVWL